MIRTTTQLKFILLSFILMGCRYRQFAETITATPQMHINSTTKFGYDIYTLSPDRQYVMLHNCKNATQTVLFQQTVAQRIVDPTLCDFIDKVTVKNLKLALKKEYLKQILNIRKQDKQELYCSHGSYSWLWHQLNTELLAKLNYTEARQKDIIPAVDQSKLLDLVEFLSKNSNKYKNIKRNQNAETYSELIEADFMSQYTLDYIAEKNVTLIQKQLSPTAIDENKEAIFIYALYRKIPSLLSYSIPSAFSNAKNNETQKTIQLAQKDLPELLFRVYSPICIKNDVYLAPSSTLLKGEVQKLVLPENIGWQKSPVTAIIYGNSMCNEKFNPTAQRTIESQQCESTETIDSLKSFELSVFSDCSSTNTNAPLIAIEVCSQFDSKKTPAKILATAFSETALPRDSLYYSFQKKITKHIEKFYISPCLHIHPDFKDILNIKTAE